MQRMELWIARHGPNDLGGSEVRDRERALTPRGMAHVRAVAERMKRDGERPRAILSSPFQRTMDTADIIGTVHDVRVIPSTELCPWHPLFPLVCKFACEGVSGVMMVGHHTSFEILLDNIGDGCVPSVLACGEVRRYEVTFCAEEGRWKMCLCYRVTPADVGMGDMIT